MRQIDSLFLGGLQPAPFAMPFHGITAWGVLLTYETAGQSILTLVPDAVPFGMGKHEKLLERMRANPRDWRIEDLEAVARRFGVLQRRRGGSHVIFYHPDIADQISIPAHKPIKPVYVKRLMTLLEEVEQFRR